MRRSRRDECHHSQDKHSLCDAEDLTLLLLVSFCIRL